MINKSMLLAVMLLSGCASNYQFGDLSEAYCTSTSAEFRAELKAKLSEEGLNIGVDYCSMYGFIEVVN